MHIGIYTPVYVPQNACGALGKGIGISEYDDSVCVPFGYLGSSFKAVLRRGTFNFLFS